MVLANMSGANARAAWLSGGSKCPMGYGADGSKDNGGGSGGSSSEPPDTPDRPITNAHADAVVVRNTESSDPMEAVPGSSIPASGRGNSDSGHTWLNPSPNQLFRALARRDKAIEYEDAPAVAHVHEIVVNSSWDGVMEFENMHKTACSEPTLARFEGMDGIYSPKARVMKTLFGMIPFDRHDWTVDRCGKEIRYIIDYYAIGELVVCFSVRE